MTGWMASYIALWILVVVLSVVVVGAYRQIGIMQLRLGNAGALDIEDQGPPIGDPIPPRSLVDVRGGEHSIGDGAEAMLVFMSVGCPACEHLLPSLHVYNQEYRTIIVTGGLESAAMELSSRAGSIPVVWNARLVDDYAISLPPFAVRVDSRGKVVGKGIVNNLRQIENLERESFERAKAHAISRLEVSETKRVAP